MTAGDEWAPYPTHFSGDIVFNTLNQIANIELNQLMDTSLNSESTNLTPVFENLFEFCFYRSYTQATLPHHFPDYSATPGALATSLMPSGIYAALITRIEAAWKKAWAMFKGAKTSSEPAPVLTASFPESPLGQALLQAFRHQLLLELETLGNNILDAPKVTPEDGKVYAELMHRQLYMLMQFIEAE